MAKRRRPRPLRAGRPSAAPTRPMFDRLAATYDRGNRVISLGQDLRWKRRAVALLAPRPGGHYLDCGAGTGDLTRLILAATGNDCHVTALDASPTMLRQGNLFQDPRITAVPGDAQNPRLAARAFDGTISGFLLRNLPDLPKFFSSMHRVLKPGAPLVVLEIAYPSEFLARQVFKAYFHGLAPLLGGLATGQWSAYRYLSRSLRTFPAPSQLAAMAQSAGFQSPNVRSSRGLGFFLLHTRSGVDP